MAYINGRTEKPWLVVALLISIFSLIIQFYPGFPSLIIYHLDVRNWDWIDSIWWSIRDFKVEDLPKINIGIPSQAVALIVNLIFVLIMLLVRKRRRKVTVAGNKQRTESL